MDHGHPTPETLPTSQHAFVLPQPTSQPKAFHSVPTTPPARNSPQPSDAPLSLQHRRLQLRKSGFRATKFPSHRLTAQSRWMPGRDDQEKNSYRCEENRSPTACHAKQVNYGSISNILQEITNSSQGRRVQRRPGISIFEDPSIQSLPGDTSSPHRSKESPPSQSKSLPTTSSSLDIEDSVVLREVSSSECTPPLHFNVVKHKGKKRKNIVDTPDTGDEVSRYIEHLETQLAALQRSMTSPETGRPIQTKVRRTSLDNKRLKQIIEEWEEEFDLRVKEAVEHQATVEADLRRKIKTLEDEITFRDGTIRDLQYNYDCTRKDIGSVEALKLSMERLESSKDAVEATNRSLEKRNDALTELLAQSPTRALHVSETASISTNLNAWSTPRPRPRPMSMLPRLPSSPHSSYSWRPLSLQVSPVTPSTLALFSDHATATPRDMSPGTEGSNINDTISESSSLTGEEPFRHGFEANQLASQRSSIISQSSESSSTIDLPLPSLSPEGKSQRAGKDRRSRRFAPRSTGLKPLLLPTLPGNCPTNAMTSPEQPPPYSFQAYTEPVDVITDFDSSLDVYDTPTQPKRRSSTRVDEETLRALEGNSELDIGTFEENLASDANKAHALSQPNFSHFPSLTNTDIIKLVPQSLATEKSKEKADGIDAASYFTDPRNQVEEMGEHHQTLSSEQSAWMALPSSSQVDPKLGPIPSLHLSVGTSNNSRRGGDLRKRPLPVTSNSSPCLTKHQKPDLDVSPTRPSQPSFLRAAEPSQATPHMTQNSPRSAEMARPSASLFLTNRTMLRTISLYRVYIRELHNDPASIARHVNANAWHSNWKRLGEFSWWVLGLFHGPRRRTETIRGTNGGSALPERGACKVGSAREEGKSEDDYNYCDQTNQNRPWSSQESNDGVKGRCSTLLSHPCRCSATFSHKREPSDDKVSTQQAKEPTRKSWTKSLYLWGKFSFAIALAIGAALVKGPEEMLRGCEESTSLDLEQDKRCCCCCEPHAAPLASSSRSGYGHSTHDDEADTDCSYSDSLSYPFDENVAVGANCEESPPAAPQPIRRTSNPSSPPTTATGTAPWAAGIVTVRRNTTAVHPRQSQILPTTPLRPSTAPPASLDSYGCDYGPDQGCQPVLIRQ